MRGKKAGLSELQCHIWTLKRREPKNEKYVLDINDGQTFLWARIYCPQATIAYKWKGYMNKKLNSADLVTNNTILETNTGRVFYPQYKADIANVKAAV